MYEENENKRNNEDVREVKVKEKSTKSIGFKADWTSIIVKLVIFLLVVFVVIFAAIKIRNAIVESRFKKNMDAMKNAAYTYFKEDENRPVLENEEIYLTLQDMIAADMIEPLKLNKKTFCSTSDSDVSLTKKDSTKYDLNVHLICGEKERSEKHSFYYKAKSSTSSSSTKESSNTKDNKTTSVKESDTKENSGTTLYEQLRKVSEPASYACPDGYILSGSHCYSNVETLSVLAVPKYKVTPTVDVAASYKKGETTMEYADVIEKKTPEKLECPSGFTLTGGICKQTIEASLSHKTEYSCPKGTLSGTRCVIEANAVANTTYVCSKGKLTTANRCYLTMSVKTKCKTGKYSLLRDSCALTVLAKTSYGKWSYVGTVTTTKTLKSTQTIYYKLQKTINGKNVYRKYTRKINYTCSKGKYNGSGLCVYYDKSDLYNYCSDSTYKLSDDKTICYKYTNASVKKTTSSCPSGYSKVNGKCVKYVNAASQTYNVYKCPTGYTLENVKKCVKEREATIKKEEVEYSCPDGYTKMGSGSNTKCYKKVTKEGYYYCKDENATLEGSRCITPSVTTFIGYNCPRGYELSGDTCYSFTKNEKISATKVSKGYTQVETIWSEKKYLSGWDWTGKTKVA